ncbi:MAG TPA: hypothetical protein VMH50_00885 [Thermoleophilia bacterium]|nr:hypothetical protein [Thermoleophilia bacterium]
MSRDPVTQPVEVWLWEPGEERKPFDHAADPIEYLPADAPLPRTGDIVVLPPNLTGDDSRTAFAYGGTRTPYRVVECEHIYYRRKQEGHDPTRPRPAQHVKTLVFVRRMSEKEFYDDRGWQREPAD